MPPTTISKLNYFRQLLLVGGKLTGIILCIYFMNNAKDYSISWSLFTWLLPSVGITISSLLSSIGVYILIIPFTILLTSLLMPENKILGLISSLIGGASLIIGGIKFMTITDYTSAINFKLFSVTKTISLSDKRDIFITEFKRLALDNYFHLKETYDFLMQRLTTQYLTKYDETLHHLQQPSEIKQYAYDIVTTYAASIKPIIHSFSIPWKSIIIFGSIIILALAVVVLANRLSVNETLYAELGRTSNVTAALALETNANVITLTANSIVVATEVTNVESGVRVITQWLDKHKSNIPDLS